MVVISRSMLSGVTQAGTAAATGRSILSDQNDAKIVRFTVTSSVGGTLLLHGERVASFSDVDLDEGAVKFQQQPGAAKHMYDGGSLAGFGYAFVQDGRASRPMFFPINVVQDKQLSVPQASLTACAFRSQSSC